jgi:hypothetical protein
MRISGKLAASMALVALATAAVGGQSARQRPAAQGKTTTARAPTPARAAEKPAAAPAPEVEKPVPFKAGEVLTYDVSYSGALSAGEATISVREKRPSYNSTAYYVVAEAKPTGLLARMYTLYYKADTLVDVFTLLPQRGSFFSLEGKRSRQKTTMFNQEAGTADYELKTASLVKQRLKIVQSSQDVLSILVSLRTTQLQLGGRVTMPLCDGGRQYTVTFTAEGRETLKTIATTATAWRLNAKVNDDKGQSLGRSVSIWVSDDTRRLPLKLKAELSVGSFVVELTKVTG